MAFLSVKNLLTLIQKRSLSTSTGFSSPTLQKSPLFTVEYLINSCGLSLSASKKLKLDDDNNLRNAQSVFDYLKSNGFEETQIAKLLGKNPRILIYGVENNLKPKLEFFVQNGFTGTLLADLFISNPTIFNRNLGHEIKPSFEVLKELLSSDDVMKAMKRCAWYFRGGVKENLRSNVDFMIKEGVPVANVSKLVLLNPISVMKKPHNLARDVKAVKDLGLSPDTLGFMHALRMMVQMTEDTLSKKMDVFRSLGWTKDETLSMFKRSPFCFSCSEEKIRNNVKFFVDTFKVDPEFLIASPVLLTYSTDRISKRYKVLKVLESNKLLKWDNKIARLMITGEKFFFEKYVAKYEKDIPGLLEIYKNNGASEVKKIDKSMAKTLRDVKN